METDDIILELVRTERTYVEDLQLFRQGFVDPVRKSSRSPKSPAMRFSNQPEVRDFLEQSRQICYIHATFLENLEHIFQHSIKPIEDISQLFIASTAPMKLYYKSYARLYQTFLETTRQFAQPPAVGMGDALMGYLSPAKPNCRTPFNMFLRDCCRYRLDGRDLASFLILPIQRLPRYLLLLEKIKRNSGNNVPEDLSKAVDDLQLCISQIENSLSPVQASSNNSSFSLFAFQEIIQSQVDLAYSVLSQISQDIRSAIDESH